MGPMLAPWTLLSGDIFMHHNYLLLAIYMQKGVTLVYSSHSLSILAVTVPSVLTWCCQCECFVTIVTSNWRLGLGTLLPSLPLSPLLWCFVAIVNNVTSNWYLGLGILLPSLPLLPLMKKGFQGIAPPPPPRKKNKKLATYELGIYQCHLPIVHGKPLLKSS